MKIQILILCYLLSPLFIFSQETEPRKAEEQSTEPMSTSHEVNNEEDMMKKWMELISLGDEHEDLAKDVGHYHYHMKFWTHPGVEPMESEGETTVEAIMDGRYFVERHKGESMGMPFHGMAIVGFDKLEQKYVSTWIDNMGTGIMKFTGERNTDGEIVSTTVAINPMTGQQEQHRVVTKNNAQGWIMEYFISSGPDKDEFKSMHVEYTRKD